MLKIVIEVVKHYLEGKNTADEEQHDEDQAHITESSDLLFVGKVIRLHGSHKNRSSSGFNSSKRTTSQEAVAVHRSLLTCEMIHDESNAYKNLCEPQGSQ